MRVRNLLFIPVLLAVAGGAYLWSQRDSVAEKLLKDQLAELSIPVESLTVTSFTTRRMELADVKLGEGGALHAERATIDFHYDWSTRKLGPFDAIFEGVELRGQVQDGEILLGGIEKAWSEALVTPNSKAIAVELNGALKLSRDKEAHYTAELSDGLLTLKQDQKNMLLPLQLTASGEGDLSNFNAQGKFHDARKRVKGSFDATYDITKKQGHITWKTDPMRFSEGALTFAQLSPAFAEGVTTISSRLSLSGVVNLQPDKWTVTPKIIVLELPVDTLLASALGEGTKVKGTVKGQVPIRISKGGNWRLEKSRLINIGPMNIAVDPTATGTAMDAHPQAELVKSALSNLEVETLTLDVASIDDKGGVKLDWHFIGRNPDVMGGKPVDLTLAVTMNLRDMWRSMQEVKRATREAEKQLLRKH